MTPVEARIKPTGIWRKCSEVSREGGLVRVIYQGRFYTVPEKNVRDRRKR